MNNTIQMVLDLVERREIKISSHGYDELAEDGILVKDIMEGVKDAKVIEDYPNYPKGPCVLVLQKDLQGEPVHVLWGIPKHAAFTAVLITAYRPSPDYWTQDFLRRK